MQGSEGAGEVERLLGRLKVAWTPDGALCCKRCKKSSRSSD